MTASRSVLEIVAQVVHGIDRSPHADLSGNSRVSVRPLIPLVMLVANHGLFYLLCRRSIREVVSSLEDRGEFGQHFIHDGRRHAFELSGLTGGQFKGTRPITTNDTRRVRSTPHQRHGKPGHSGEVSSTGDRQDHRRFRQPVEGGRRHDQNGAAPLLFMTGSRVGRHEGNIPSLPHGNSLPTALLSSQARSSGPIPAEGSH